MSPFQLALSRCLLCMLICDKHVPYNISRRRDMLKFTLDCFSRKRRRA